MYGKWKKRPWPIKILWGIGALILGAAFVSLGAFVAMSLWNYVVPGITGWKTIEFWQALALVVLVRILFGFPGRHGHRAPWGHKRERYNMEGMGPWAGHGGPENFHAYKDFWKEEGREAFEKFVEKRKNQSD